jgi:Lipopolysaccharide-assembly
MACSITFNPASIPESIKTYYVPQFQDNTENGLPNLGIQFTEALKDKVRLQSRLRYTEESPDIELRGTVVDFRITAEAPRTGEETAINRLTITLAVEYFNNQTNKEVWKRNFSFFFNYPSDQDLSAVQDRALKAITDQLMEDIFNAAFSDW